jgi:hypothetical protein
MAADTPGEVTSRHEIVERLHEELGARVAERQSLRAAGADGETLERNRAEICGLQQRLARALIARYLPARAQAA